MLLKVFKWKKLLAALLSAALLLAAPVSVCADDLENHWAKETILRWAGMGFIAGDEKGNYNPDEKVSRAEFMAFVNRSRAFAAVSTKIEKYTDVPEESWYYDDVRKALAAGYMAGTSETTMSPEDSITREQGIAIAARLIGINTGKIIDMSALTTLEDAADLSGWARPYVVAALEHDLVAPDNGRVYPQALLSRAETVLLLDKVYNIINQPPHALVSYEDWQSDTFAGGSGTATDPYLIASPKQLVYLSEQTYPKEDDGYDPPYSETPAAFASAHYRLAANIDMKDAAWKPIAPEGFTGTFDGNGHVISNLTVNPETKGFGVGLFGIIKFGTVKNLGMHNVDLSGVGLIGAIAGGNTGGVIEGCYVDGLVKIHASQGNVGVLTATNLSEGQYIGLIKNCYIQPDKASRVIIDQKKNYDPFYTAAGGLAGVCGGTIETSYVSGVTYQGSSYSGAVVGVISEGARINNCYYNEEGSNTEGAIGLNQTDDDYVIVGRIPEKMKTKTPYPGFDMNVWRFIEGYYPTLAAMDPKLNR